MFCQPVVNIPVKAWAVSFEQNMATHAHSIVKNPVKNRLPSVVSLVTNFLLKMSSNAKKKGR
jgi:hypothetical protein